jgi:hypothetical protein
MIIQIQHIIKLISLIQVNKASQNPTNVEAKTVGCSEFHNPYKLMINPKYKIVHKTWVKVSDNIHYCIPLQENKTYCHVLQMGSVTNNSTWIRIGYQIYSLWRFTPAHITVTEDILTLALVASWVLLSELHCTDSLTRTNSEDQLA